MELFSIVSEFGGAPMNVISAILEACLGHHEDYPTHMNLIANTILQSQLNCKNGFSSATDAQVNTARMRSNAALVEIRFVDLLSIIVTTLIVHDIHLRIERVLKSTVHNALILPVLSTVLDIKQLPVRQGAWSSFIEPLYNRIRDKVELLRRITWHGWRYARMRRGLLDPSYRTISWRLHRRTYDKYALMGNGSVWTGSERIKGYAEQVIP